MEPSLFSKFLLNANLEYKEHQKNGVKWCLNNEIKGNEVSEGRIVRGGLLADEMGLGKTIQILGVMNENPKDHTLIVIPKALLAQWKNAIVKYMGIVPLIYHTSGKRNASEELLSNTSIVITTYALITDRKYIQNPLLSIEWNRVVFDEAHHLRTARTKIFQGAMLLKAQIRWLVTGTPIQNRKSDFYSLCAVMGIPKSYYINEEKLMDLVRAFIKKRTKNEVGINLPKLRNNEIQIKWKNEVERNIAIDIHSKLKFYTSYVKKTTNISILPKEYTILPLLIKARQICILPSIIKNIETKTTKGSKMEVVLETIISRKDNNRAKLIFCHFRGEIERIKDKLQEANMKVFTFDGRTTEKQRAYTLSKDNSYDALILQIQTGCEGLNLQQFSEVYFVSPHWNPAVEEQAIARCHRIGQKNEIDVYRFIMSGFDEDYETCSLDMYALNIQETKHRIMNMIEETP